MMPRSKRDDRGKLSRFERAWVFHRKHPYRISAALMVPLQTPSRAPLHAGTHLPTSVTLCATLDIESPQLGTLPSRTSRRTVSSSPPRSVPPEEVFASNPDDSFIASSDDIALPAGYTLGNYVVRAVIGQGATGAVYRAEHQLLKKTVALKVLARSLVSNVDARRRFLREAEVAAAIKHPNV